MTEDNYAAMRSMMLLGRMGVWVLFLIAEGSLIACEWHRHLYKIGSFYFWYLPIACTMPLVVGRSLIDKVRKNPARYGSRESVMAISAMMELIVIVAYLAIATITISFL